MNLKYKLIYILILISMPAYSNQDLEIFGRPIGCKNEQSGFLQKVAIKSTVLLNKNFLSTDNYKSAIELQIKHLLGFFKNTKAHGLNVALSGYRGALKINKVSHTSYNRSLVVDSYLPQERGEAQNDYIKKAIAAGKVEVNDPAVKIDYEAELIIADCNQGSFIKLTDIYLPLDPYLSMWVENASDRKERVFAPFKIKSVSNCTSDEIAQFGNYDQNWYFWSPIDKKRDQQCRLNTDLVIIPEIKKLKVYEKQNDHSAKFLKEFQTMNVSTVFGIIEPGEVMIPFKFSQHKKQLIAALSECVNQRDVPKCMTQWDYFLAYKQDGKNLEFGFLNYVVYLKYLAAMVRLNKYDIKQIGDDEVIINLKGKILASQKNINISAYYGKTNLDYGKKVSKSYAQFLNNSFQNADLLSYVGHAGLGKNLNYNEIEKVFSNYNLPKPKRTKPLWFGIYNCEGFSFFGFDLNKLFLTKQNLLLTQTTGVESGAKFPLSQLNVVLHGHQDDLITTENLMGRYVKTKDFLVELNLVTPAVGITSSR